MASPLNSTILKNKEEITPILYKLFPQKTEEEGIFPNSFFKASIILTPKAKTLQEERDGGKKLQTSISYGHKNPHQILANKIQQHIQKELYTK